MVEAAEGWRPSMLYSDPSGTKRAAKEPPNEAPLSSMSVMKIRTEVDGEMTSVKAIISLYVTHS